LKAFQQQSLCITFLMLQNVSQLKATCLVLLKRKWKFELLYNSPDFLLVGVSKLFLFWVFKFQFYVQISLSTSLSLYDFSKRMTRILSPVMGVEVSLIVWDQLLYKLLENGKKKIFKKKNRFFHIFNNRNLFGFAKLTSKSDIFFLNN